jgi:hypothetical protein
MHTNNLREKPARLSAQVQAKRIRKKRQFDFGFGITSEGANFVLKKFDTVSLCQPLINNRSHSSVGSIRISSIPNVLSSALP